MGLNARRHWRTIHAENRRWRKAVSLAIRKLYPEAPLRLASLELVRCSAREPDWDNLVTSFKPILDALETLGIIQSDRMSCIGQPRYRWEKAPRGKGSVSVHVREAEPPHSIDCTDSEL